MSCLLCGFDTKVTSPTCKNGPCRSCAEVAMVDEDINQAVAVTKRYDLRSEHNLAHDLMHRLPLELRNYIFELVLPTRDEWGRIVQVGRPSGTVIPSFLTSICRSWRDTAWANPSFWSTIRIAFSRPSSEWINFLHDWILRSRTLPLTLIIVLTTKNEDLEEESERVLDVITQYPNKWQSLSLDIPSYLVPIFHHSSDFQSHLLSVKRLRIKRAGPWTIATNIGPISNPEMSPEKVQINGFTFQSIRISWSHLTSATVEFWALEAVTLLFQHASQMTYCYIFAPRRTLDFAIPPIIHRKLQTLSLHCMYQEEEVVHVLLNSITLPCLQEFCTTETNLLDGPHLPALVYRSSCPLTRVTIYGEEGTTLEPLLDLQPLPGVTDLVLKKEPDSAFSRQLLLEGYFPNLRHLTLRLQTFLDLWYTVFVPIMLDPGPHRLALRKIIVVDPHAADESNPLWVPESGRILKAFQSRISLREGRFNILEEVQASICLREDGCEISIPDTS